MGRGSVRWIAIAVVGAMVAAVAVALLGGASPDADDAAGAGGDDADRAAGRATEVLDGPHAVVELCTDVTCPAADDAAQQALLTELEGDARVASAELITSEQAYAMFLDRFGDQQELVDQVDPAEVPARIELDLFDPQAVTEVVEAYAGRAGVARVIDARTVDP